MKKNGFIATSIMFSFFLVFTMLSLLVLASYTHYRTLINNLNMSILNDLNESVISKKYISLDNAIKDGDFKSIDTDFANNDLTYPTFYSIWNNPFDYNVEPYYDNVNNNQNSYIRMAYHLNNSSYSGRAKISKKFDPEWIKQYKDNNYHKIYVAFKIFRNGVINCSSGTVTIRVGSNRSNLTNNKVLCGSFSNWTIESEILNVRLNSEDQEIIFQTEGIDHQTRFISIRDIKVVDVTKLYKEGTTDAQMKEYLDRELPYIEENYALARY